MKHEEDQDGVWFTMLKCTFPSIERISDVDNIIFNRLEEIYGYGDFTKTEAVHRLSVFYCFRCNEFFDVLVANERIIRGGNHKFVLNLGDDDG